MEQLEWHNEKRKVRDLLPYDRNPRKITDQQKEKLKESLEKFNLVEVPAVNLDNMIVAGHQRVKILELLGRIDEEIDVRVPNRLLTHDEYLEYNIRSNKNTGDFDWQILLADTEKELLKSIGFSEKEIKKNEFAHGNTINRSLIEDYIVPPFTVLDTRQGYWQDRKREWIKQIGDSGEGREEDLIGEGLSTLSATKSDTLDGTSIFDPVLAEVLYTWYCKKGGLVIDPFAGGHVRGMVAALSGYKYIGTDLRSEQVVANDMKAKQLGWKGDEELAPRWHAQNGNSIGRFVQEESADMLMTCPPYFNLEEYSDLPGELSNLNDYQEFLKQYGEILKKARPLLKPESYAIIVIGNIRDDDGNLLDLVGDTTKLMQEAGFTFYNDAVLITQVGTAMLRARKTFDNGKKLVRTHQKVLMYKNVLMYKK